ncbi:MAG: hypothetical protein WC865_11955 [Bacteroidales bacterium]
MYAPGFEVVPKVKMVRIPQLNVKDQPGAGGTLAEIRKNSTEVWPSRPVLSGKPVSYDLKVLVKKGDAVYFIVKKNSTAENEKVTWDPVVTYL